MNVMLNLQDPKQAQQMKEIASLNKLKQTFSLVLNHIYTGTEPIQRQLRDFNAVDVIKCFQ